MTASFQLIDARPSRPALQVWKSGPPPLPDQTTIGLPSAAAFFRASHRLVSHEISRHLDSSGCGLISLWTFTNCSGEMPGDCSRARTDSGSDPIPANHSTRTVAPVALLPFDRYMPGNAPFFFPFRSPGPHRGRTADGRLVPIAVIALLSIAAWGAGAPRPRRGRKTPPGSAPARRGR